MDEEGFCDCDHDHYPDELTDLLDNIYLHTTMCFPQVVINQETAVMGVSELMSGDDLEMPTMRLIAKDSVSTWTAICTHCGWSGSVTMQDNIPAWEELPEEGENEDTD